MAEKEQIYGVKPKVAVTEEVKTERYDEIFVLVTRNKKTQIAINNAIVSKITFNSVKAAKEYIDKKPWELITNTMFYMMDLKFEQVKPSNK